MVGFKEGDIRVCKDDSSTTSVLDGEFHFTTFSSYTSYPISLLSINEWDRQTDSSCEMVSVESFDIFDLEGIEVDIV
jgi:hypothetical protein